MASGKVVCPVRALCSRLRTNRMMMDLRRRKRHIRTALLFREYLTGPDAVTNSRSTVARGLKHPKANLGIASERLPPTRTASCELRSRQPGRSNILRLSRPATRLVNNEGYRASWLLAHRTAAMPRRWTGRAFESSHIIPPEAGNTTYCTRRDCAFLTLAAV